MKKNKSTEKLVQLRSEPETSKLKGQCSNLYTTQAVKIWIEKSAL